MLIMSYSAEPFAQALTTFERQALALADRRRWCRVISTATTAMTRTPRMIHSHGLEAPDPAAAGEGEGAAEASELRAGTGTRTRTVVGSAVGGAVVGFGALVRGEKVGGEMVRGETVGGETLRSRLGEMAGKAVAMLLPCAQPAARNPAARIVVAVTSFAVRWCISGLL